MSTAGLLRRTLLARIPNPLTAGRPIPDTGTGAVSGDSHALLSSGSRVRELTHQPSGMWGVVERDDLIALVLLLASGSLFYLAPWAPVYLVALLVTFGLAVWRPVPSLALVPTFAPFFMDPKHIGPLQPAPQEIFLGVSLVAFGVRTRLGARLEPLWPALVRSPFLLPGGLFLLAAFISTAFAAEHRLAFRALYQVVLEPMLYFVLLTLFVRHSRQWWLLILTLVGTGVFVGCVGIGQLLTGQGLSLVPDSTVQRVKAFYGSPDNLGLLLDRVIPFWAAGLLFAPWRRRSLALWFVLGIPLLLALIYTYSRGAWFAVGVVGVILLALRPGWTRWAALILVILAGFVGGLKSNSVARVLQTGHANTAGKRIDIWRSSLHMIRDHPIVGIGPDNFRHYYSPRPHQQLYSPDCPRGLGYLIDTNVEVSKEPCLSHPHNEVLDLWLSTGIAGLIAFVWLQIVFWRLALRWYPALRGTSEIVIALGAAGAMLAMLLHGLVDNSYFLMDLSLLFWLLCAIVQSLGPSLRTEESAK